MVNHLGGGNAGTVILHSEEKAFFPSIDQLKLLASRYSFDDEGESIFQEIVQELEADNEIREKVYLLQEAQEQRKELEKKEKQLKTQIQGFMGDAGLLDAGFCKVALKEIKSTRFNANAFKEKYTELYQQYLNDSSYRKLHFIGG